MPFLYQDQVIFSVMNGWALEVWPLPGVDPDAVTRIEVPLSVTRHFRQTFYHLFPNLLEIAAHPKSRSYETYDGALYSREGKLILVPLGKSTLHLAPFIRQIEYHAFYGHDRLKEIIPDSDDIPFAVQNGCLIAKDGRTVYFVTNSEKRLCIPERADCISDDVWTQGPRSVEIAPGNEWFCLENGILVGHGSLCWLSDTERVCLPKALHRLTTREAHQFFFHTESISVCPDHPIFRAEDNVLLNHAALEVVYVGAQAGRLTVPDGYTLAEGCLADAASLREVSIPFNLPISGKAFRLSGQVRKDPHIPLAITLRWPDGSACTTEGDLLSVTNALRRQTVEIKPGTELFYLDLFLSGRVSEGSQRRSFDSGVFRMLCCLIDRNDLSRIQRVIADHRLITRKNCSRLIRYAQQNQRNEIAEMLLAAKSGPLPSSLSSKD